MIVVKRIISLFTLASLILPAVRADEGGSRSSEGDLKALASLIVPAADEGGLRSADAPKASCVDYTSTFDPKYRECKDGDFVLRKSLGFNQNDVCVFYKGKPCRVSYVCPKGSVETLAVDCRNLFKPGTKCAAYGCNGKCIAYPKKSKKPKFNYAKNKCGRMGWHCVGVGYGLASCYWNTYLPNGKVVRIGTNEPESMIGQPEALGYYGECFPTINGVGCKSCEIECTLSGGNYAQFDCTNLISSYGKQQCPA